MRMRNKKNFVADGVSIVEQTAFQSFPIQVSSRKGAWAIVIPEKLKKHLSLTDDTILEVAIRKIPFEYAHLQYLIDFFPHTVICPKCGMKGRVSHFGNSNSSAVSHYEKGRKGTKRLCCMSVIQTSELIKNYQESKRSQFISSDEKLGGS